jgi:GGDEF domain-containing protein
MTTNAIFSFVTAASFIACGYALAEQGQLILTSRPANWAEEINSIVAIAGLSGMGALSLTLNQMRIANGHKSDAMKDALTGLLNRRALLDNPEEIAPTGTAVVMMDLDYFKTINDRFGHDSGDRILMAFADVIHANIRSNDPRRPHGWRRVLHHHAGLEPEILCRCRPDPLTDRDDVDSNNKRTNPGDSQRRYRGSQSRTGNAAIAAEPGRRSAL